VLIEKNSDIFSQFSIVIATELPEKSVLKLSEICWNLHIPLVVARCYGLFGYLRVAVPEHTGKSFSLCFKDTNILMSPSVVIEAHPDNPVDDLRLDNPLPEVQKLASELDFASMTSEVRSHVPYILLLLRASKIWKESVCCHPPWLSLSLTHTHTYSNYFCSTMESSQKPLLTRRASATSSGSLATPGSRT